LDIIEGASLFSTTTNMIIYDGGNL